MSNTRSNPSATIVVDDSLDGEVKSRPAHHRLYAWRSGAIPKYSSLWCVVLRFALLNRPDFRMLKADLVVGDSPDSWSNQYIDSGTTIRFSSIRKDFLADVLGEPHDAFEWSLVYDFPYGLQEHTFLYPPRICLACIKQGFHTALFSSLWLDKCPIHDEILISKCPNCGKFLDDVLRQRKSFAASICGCDNQWMSFEMARKPLLDKHRDECIGSIISWMEQASKRCWTYFPRSAIYNPLIVTFQQVSHGLAEFGESMPSWVRKDVAEHHLKEEQKSRYPLASTFDDSSSESLFSDRTKTVHVFGDSLESLSRLENISLSEEVGFEDVWKKNTAPSRAIFKSMRRYLFKQLLGNRIHLIYWVASNQSSEMFRKEIEKNRYIIVAWAILYWMRSSIWREIIVEKWLKRLLVCKSGFSIYDKSLHTRNSGAQRTILNGAEGPAARWIEARVNAAELQDLWPTQEDLVRCSTDAGFIDAMRGTPVRTPIEWWAWRNDDHRLRLAVMQRMSKLWYPIERRSLGKSVRVANYQAQESLRQLKLHNQMVAPAIRYIAVGLWQYDGDLSRFAHGPVKQTRLLMGKGSYHPIGIAKLLKGDSDKIYAPTWIFRCLDIPLVVISCNLRLGFARLRRAARFYVNSCEKSQRV